MKFAWIAVAIATAIRLYAGTQLWAAAAVALLGITAFFLTRRSTPRLAALLLVLVAVVDATSIWRSAKLATEFKQRSAAHLAHDVGHVRELITQLESDLDHAAARITQRMAGKKSDSASLFLILRTEVPEGEGRGARILDEGGVPVAWWGEDYRAPANRTFQFDVTNLYVTRSRPAKKFTVQSFVRIENVAGRMPAFHEDDAWVVSMRFHGGFPRQEPGTHRFLVAKRADSSLWVDVTPRGSAEVLDATRAEGTSTGALILAIGALIVFAIKVRSPLAFIPLAAARVALLPLRAPNDTFG
ncbi:MAG: hypothetical protein QOJ98_674, partial [Acidobacteriota bacterium]|nr:hypothetical protein [Acidobacteriota bacterium]